MSENPWDAYGKWDNIASLDDVQDVMKLISGNRMWRSNFVPPALHYVFHYALDEAKGRGIADPICLDFGCGLGRNAPMLRHFFGRLMGYDLPEMAGRLKSEYPDVHSLYANVLTSLNDIKEYDFSILYDSVVLQHITNRPYVGEFIEVLSAKPSFRTFVTVYNNNETIDTNNPHYPHIQLLVERGWKLWHREIETLSFEGAPHAIAVFRRW